MTGYEFVLLVLAGIGAALAGSVAGLASLISYPSLLAAGLSPISANVTNTVALVCGGFGYALGSRPEMDSQDKPLVVKLAMAGALGGLTGGVLLLASPAATFTRVVPWMIGIGSLTILIRPRPSKPISAHSSREAVLLIALAYLISVYAGYFGAGAGILLLAALLHLSAESLPRSKAVQNIVLLLANSVAVIYFISSGTISWVHAIPLALGAIVGGWLGPLIVRHVPVHLLRILISTVGLATAARLAWLAYT